MTLGQTFTTFVDSGVSGLSLTIGIAEIVIGLALALTWLWQRRGWLKLNSSSDRSRDRHTFLFTAAGLMAMGSGIAVLLGKVSGSDSLIPLAMVGAAAVIALIPSHADSDEG